ncbi:hypothetical protein DFH28DRAFT_83018 [Melampsora americana]|nr:hypothetical protein DFH28DRAFT_83018 [Melampsora americana]
MKVFLSHKAILIGSIVIQTLFQGIKSENYHRLNVVDSRRDEYVVETKPIHVKWNHDKSQPLVKLVSDQASGDNFLVRLADDSWLNLGVITKDTHADFAGFDIKIPTGQFRRRGGESFINFKLG